MFSGQNKALLLGIVLSLCLGIVIGLYIAPRPKAESTETTYDPMPPIVVSKDSTELRPVSATKPDSIIYITVYRDRPANVEPAPPQAPSQPIIDTMASYRATVEDWNIKREYADTLIDSDTLGRATYRATVQYNKLTEFDFRYEPRQKSVTTVVQPPARLQPYALANITTQWSSVGVGLKYGKVGFHVIGGYDYKLENPSIGGGLLVVF